MSHKDSAAPFGEGPQDRNGHPAERRDYLESRVREKIEAYEAYSFNTEESRALNVFFDLAQEYSNVYDLYALCVIVPRVFFGRKADLYLLDASGELEWRCGSEHGCDGAMAPSQPPPLVLEPEVHNGSYVIPIKGNKEMLAQLSVVPTDGLLGLLMVSPGHNLDPHERLFFEKYTNRIGFQLHNRLIGTRNREHLQFIRSLVDDIGHNVIVPNMYFKLFYRRLESKILVLRDISLQFGEYSHQCALSNSHEAAACMHLKKEMDYAYQSLMEQFREIYRHYEQTSLFLETLLRRGHFEQGHYVLEKQSVNLKRQVVAPQVERYRPRFLERGIELLTPSPAELDPGLEVVADVGLLSQVFANFFSNAVKYAREPVSAPARFMDRKFVTYGCLLLPDMFGPGQDGVRCQVYSSGPSMSPEEAAELYTEGFRGSNVDGEYGTGHGLHFVREVVSLHGGVVGYEAGEAGNIFFFVLPRAEAPETDKAKPQAQIRATATGVGLDAARAPGSLPATARPSASA